MYLKSIEIHGFKSFANKIRFEFHNGITGIVGPNGSGKSNVADAVRWVLGEQRVKQLRGGSMQDVIFAGTEIRKPMSYAYVAITLDNSDHSLPLDYEEVTIARRLYRSGESEYLLNGTACRLRDVNEIFYDTGVGKEGYSIIGQGQIDKILSGKPEDRRELFDEAAGIVKFKRRKAAAVKKLEDEKQNRLRVSDIVAELERQVGPLERQAEKARVYLKKREDLKNLDVDVFLLENRRLKEQLKEVTDGCSIAQNQLDEANAKQEQIRLEYDNIVQRIEELDRQIEENRTKLSESGVRKERLEGEIGILQEQINSARGTEKHLQDRREALARDVEERTKGIDGYLAEKQQIDQRLQENEEKNSQAEFELEQIQDNIRTVNDTISAKKNRIIEELNNRAALKAQMSRLDTMQEQVQIRNAELNSRLLQARSDEEAQEAHILELEAEYEEMTELIKQLEAEQDDLNSAVENYRKVLEGLDQQMSQAQERYHSKKSRLEAVANIAERYEGYGNAIRRVMEQKDRTPGVIGVVADLLRVDKKYEVAIETALGGSIQNVVTENEDTAKRMIAYLKETKGGRATFLPLTSIRNHQEMTRKEVLREPGVLGLADSLVDIDDRYRDVAASLLGRIVVVDHVDHAVMIARKYRYAFRMVTLEGELFAPGGSISGGAFRNSSNLLGRRRELEQLEQELTACKEEIHSIQQDIDDVKNERNSMRVRLESKKTELQMKLLNQNTLKLSLQAAEERREENEQGSQAIDRERAQIEEQQIDIQNQKLSCETQIKASEKMEKDLGVEIEEQQEVLEQLRGEESKAQILVNEIGIETEKIRQQLDFCQQNLNRVAGELRRYEVELNEIENAIRTGVDEVTSRERRIHELELEIEASELFRQDGEQLLKQEQEQRETLSNRQKHFFAEREEIADRINALDKEVYRLTAQKEKLEETLDSQINYMWDEYELTLSDVIALDRQITVPLAEMKKQIQALKDEIRKLGDVNVNAIEEYRELMERYTFMKTQHDDLVKAQETLEGVIRELDEAMRRQFKEKFSEICREFDRVFKELFGGGKGTLELMEDEDLLEAGVRIIAQPPGKKLQNMMQLSGGEKALTAIALLFAIQNLKPSPFCLLDEIEAALDDSNVGRFANYLHKLTKYTQFIVITHRRGTMERADRLYGITMQEKGVSTLVSVSLIDSELEAMEKNSRKGGAS